MGKDSEFGLEGHFNAFKYVGGGRVDLLLRELNGRGVSTLRDLLEYIGKTGLITDKIKNYVRNSLSIAKALPEYWLSNVRPNSIREKFVKKGLRMILNPTTNHLGYKALDDHTFILF